MSSKDNDQYRKIADDLALKAFSITENFLSIDQVESILSINEFNNSLLAFKKAGIGKSDQLRVVESVRSDYIHWVDLRKMPEQLNFYVSKLKSLSQFFNEYLFLSLKDLEIHLTSFPVGSFYKRHLDQFRQENNRKISIILYLNKAWQPTNGGQLRIYFEGGMEDVFPTAGKLVCMRSDIIEHEVLPSSRERLSVTGWMLDKLID